MIRFKPEVRIVMLTEQLATVLVQAALWSLRTRVEVEVNSVDDGPNIHMQQTLHGYSLAVDLDTAGDKADETEELAQVLRRALDPQSDVLLESTHVHVEGAARRPPLRKLAT